MQLTSDVKYNKLNRRFISETFDDYFHQVIKPDISTIEELIGAGADVHACDDVGQNLMHEIARYHGAEVGVFFLNYSVNINLGKRTNS